MMRVKDPKASLEFYCNVLGFNLVMHREFPQWQFNVYFVAPVDPATIPTNPDERFAFCMRTPGCIELTWNYGSEKEEGAVYNTGNGDATGTQDGQKVRGGFGHLGITVPDVYDACARFADLGCEFTKTPNSGGMKVSVVLSRDAVRVPWAYDGDPWPSGLIHGRYRAATLQWSSSMLGKSEGRQRRGVQRA